MAINFRCVQLIPKKHSRLKYVLLVIRFTRASIKFLIVLGRWINSVSVTEIKARLRNLQGYRFRSTLTPQRSARFFLKVITVAFAVPALADEAVVGITDNCKPLKIDHWVQTRYIHDGDTVWLDDGIKVRIIGLNAPELAREGKLGEPLAVRARDALRRQVSGKLGLEYDEQRKDRYGRVLAHIYSASRVNIAAVLISKGLAHAVTFSPNVKHRQCYQGAEQVAREAGVGVWSNHYFDPIVAREVTRGGFMRVKACVQSTTDTRKVVYFQLAKDFRLRIYRSRLDDILKPFAEDASLNFSAACMVVRGWVYNDKASNMKTLTIRHSDAIETVSYP